MRKELLLFLLLAVFPLMASADEQGGINYELNGNSGDSNIPYKAGVIAKSWGKYSGDIVIPESVTATSSSGWWGSTTRTYKVTYLSDGAFSGCTGLTSVTLPSTMTTVGKDAFRGCTSLKSIYSNMLYPQSLGTEAFASVPDDCVLYIPVGTLTAYKNAGWTRESTGITIVEVGEVQENFCLENPVTHDFIQNVVYPDNDYTFTRITDYTTQSTQYRKDLPSPVRLIPPVVGEGKELVLEIYADGSMVRSDVHALESKVLEVWNLIPQKSYTYRLYVVNADDTRSEIADGSFRTEGTVRMLNIGNVYNFRDIGGWRLPNGKRIKYDKIFRTGELEITSFNSVKIRITEEGVNELLNVQGVGVEIDFGDYQGSPVKNYLEYVDGVNNGSKYKMKQYLLAINEAPQQFRNCFEKIVSSLRDGKKVIFHCNLGADRTGTLAFLLEGLLGASESDMAKDYEMTSYTYDGRYRYVDPTGISEDLYNRDHSYWKLVKYVKDNFQGSTFSEKVEQMARSLGISQQDIDDYRRLMTEVVLDEDSTTVPVAAENVDVTVRRTINAQEWSTLCLPFSMTAQQVKSTFGNDVQLAAFNDYVYDEQTDMLTVDFADVTSIEANRPYLIWVTSPVAEFSVRGVTIDPQEAVVDFDTSPTKTMSRQMVGTYVANTVLASGRLFLSGNKFWYSAGKTKIKGYRAYFNFFDVLASFSDTHRADGSRIMMTFNPVPTSVRNHSLETANSVNCYYDLQGRRVEYPQKGVYIRNGRKEVVR